MLRVIVVDELARARVAAAAWPLNAGRTRHSSSSSGSSRAGRLGDAHMVPWHAAQGDYVSMYVFVSVFSCVLRHRQCAWQFCCCLLSAVRVLLLVSLLLSLFLSI